MAKWLELNNIQFRTQPNTQDFPDFLLNPNSDKEDLLEIKTFDDNRSANFDIANFEAYCRSLKTKAYRLDSDYLIFAYTLINYQFKIKRVWLKKIWEITGNSQEYPVKCQVKQKVIYNIRPVSWYSKRSRYKPFNSRKEFVEALHQTLIKYDLTSSLSADWLKQVQENYSDHTGQSL